MRILMLSWEYPPRIVGGIARVVYDLARKLGEKGNDVHVVTCWEKGTKEYDVENGVHVHRVRVYEISTFSFIDWVHHLNFALLEEAIKLLNKTGKFDVIHVHDWIAAFAGRVLKSSYSIPLVSTIHATEHGRNCGIHNDIQRYISSIEWWLTYESWKVIVNSEYMLNEVRSIFHLPEDKLRVIPNGVDAGKFKNIERNQEFRRNFAADSEKIVFFVGRLVNEKGVQVLIDSAPKILIYYNDIKFVIAGKGPLLDYLKNKVQEMNISDKFFFTGYISDEDLAKLYKCADIAVFPSLYEPFGIVALEGIVANVPIVVSDTGGLREIINHGINGMKSYAGSANSLADSILELLFNPAKADEMARNALKKVQYNYNWDKISNQTIELYRQVIDTNRETVEAQNKKEFNAVPN